MAGDTLGLTSESLRGAPLLKEVMAAGRRTGDAGATDLEQARDRCARQLSLLPPDVCALRKPAQYPVRLSEGLKRLRTELAARH